MVYFCFQEEVMKNKLYVGNLPYQLTEEELKEAFAKAGKVVSARIVTDAGTGRSKGFAFVEMETEAEAQKAIEIRDGSNLKERTIRVAPARPPRSEGGGNRGSGYRRPSRGER